MHDLVPAASAHLVPAGYAEKAMASLMQLHSELMDEKEKRVELFRALMEKEQALAELTMYVRMLEERGAQRPSEAAQRPSEAAQRPGEAAQRPSEPAQRPSEAAQRPSEAAPRPPRVERTPVAAKLRTGDDWKSW